MKNRNVQCSSKAAISQKYPNSDASKAPCGAGLCFSQTLVPDAVLALHLMYHDADRRCPDADRRCPDVDRRYPDADRMYLDDDRMYPDVDRMCPDADRMCPDADRRCPDADRMYPDADRRYPDADRMYLDADRMNPDADRKYPDADRSCLDADRRCLIYKVGAESGAASHAPPSQLSPGGDCADIWGEGKRKRFPSRT